MLSSLFRPKRTRQPPASPGSPYHDDVSPKGRRREDNTGDYFQRPLGSRAGRNGTGTGVDADNSEEEEEDDEQEYEEDGIDGEDNEDGHDEVTPLLPIFSAAHLDAIPLYSLTHSIRLLIIQRCETTLSWDQLRSPQISQFLVKPIQQQIQNQHFSRATLYALLANCLQFNKEGDNTPGNTGVLRTRGFVAELIAMRLLKEFSTRELIDCLAYDFNPLNGMLPAAQSQDPMRLNLSKSLTYETVQRQVASRTSTLEVAIRAQAKRFLAHPLVVQHLEAVWAGNIVFHSAADSLHRYPEKPVPNKSRHYGATHTAESAMGHAQLSLQRSRGEIIRRSVTLYNPGDASLFKLSRLRVPRYRQIFSTLSYAVMLGLFLAALIDRPLDISPMEVVFWFWSAGFMLDEIVGFSEQGFGLYMVSVWNAFDIGILLLFLIYYVLRLYGIIIAETHKRRIANMAYDVLASTAILLFPRLFSLLDHYRYFSQLLIAFRMMTIDLMAILMLMVISCSGFFVAFSLSFGDNALGGPSGVIYALFQIVMGFTPAAWVVWDQYNLLGKALLAAFLIICHFLIVTILITVLTNSFMKIVQNANEEHQYLFAVNTISMVKSDALFTYIAPSNIIGWIISPIRFIIPFRQFVKINRTVIKITHFPILLTIFAWERLMLGHYAWEPTELVEQRGRQKSRLPAFSLGGAQGQFSPGVRLREPSVTTYYKDRALEEVFRQPFTGDSTIRKPAPSADRQSNVVDRWMNGVGNEGGASSPVEQPRSILEQLETTRPFLRRAMTVQNSGPRRRAPSTASRSVLSDPEQRIPRNPRRRPQPISEESEVEDSGLTTPADHHTTDADGDDERAATVAEESNDHKNDEESSEHDTSTNENEALKKDVPSNHEEDDEDDVPTPTATKPTSLTAPGSVSSLTRNRLLEATQGNSRPPIMSAGSSKRSHVRHSSTNTILYHPRGENYESSPSPHRTSKPQTRSRPQTGTSTPREFGPSIRQLSKRTPTLPLPGRQRPGMLNRDAYKSAPNVARFLEMSARQGRRAPSMGAIALDLASDIGDNRHVLASIINDETHFLGPMAGADFSSEMGGYAQRPPPRRSSADNEENRMGRMVLARMNTLEEGFKDILKEVKEWRNESSRGTSANEEDVGQLGRKLARRMEKRRAAGGLGGGLGGLGGNAIGGVRATGRANIGAGPGFGLGEGENTAYLDVPPRRTSSSGGGAGAGGGGLFAANIPRAGAPGSGLPPATSSPLTKAVTSSSF